jgi:membrane protein implicated in regulation of membrane protease activity
MLFFLGGWSLWLDYDVATANDYTMWTVPGIHWQVGGAFVIFVVSALVACFLYCRFTNPAFFKKQTLTRSTKTLVPDPDA